MRINTTSTPALVLHTGSHGTLGILRSLGRLAVPVYLVNAEPGSSVSSSRYSRRNFLWNFRAASCERSLNFLLEIGRRIGQRSILIPTCDYSAVFIAENLEALKSVFIHPHQPPGLARTLCSKKEMYFLAKRFGIPTPEVTFPQCVGDVATFAQTAKFPIMLKGIDGAKLLRRSGKTMVIVYTPRELLDLYSQMEDPSDQNLMLQEYIPGGDDTVWMFNGYFNKDSECLAGFTGKKIRQSPIHTGVTSLGICLRNTVVQKTTTDFMKAIGYRGILDIGYRYDARDGGYKVLDINPRIGATFRLFVDNNGLDVARAMYLDMTGQAVPLGAAREGRKWMVEFSDFSSCLKYRREGTLTLGEWIRSFAKVEEGAYFALDDLMPFLKLSMSLLRLKGKRLLRALREKSSVFRASKGRAQQGDAESICVLPARPTTGEGLSKPF